MNVQMKVYIYSEHSLHAHLLVRMHRGRGVAPGIAAGVAGVNGPLHYIVEVCKSDPKPVRIRSDLFGFRNQNIHFGSD